MAGFVFAFSTSRGLHVFYLSCQAIGSVVKYIQGDVVGVYNSSGTKVVGFRYDAFGRCIVSGDTSLAQWCKIRYRGYYYDTETGLYWVQTRYYNPDWCRWISPDSLSYLDTETPHGLNLYLYCGNDPVDLVDPTGNSWESFWNWISNTWNSVATWFNKNIGFTLSHGQETTYYGDRNILYHTEYGTGYNKEFKTGKPINFFINIPENPWCFWEYSIGVDINYDGNGLAIETGFKQAITIHANGSSHEFYISGIGNFGYKNFAKDESGAYAFHGVEIHFGQIALAALFIYYAGYIAIPAFGAAATAAALVT